MTEKKKTTKKKLIRVANFGEKGDIYGSSSNKYPQFSLMSPPEDGRRQCFGFLSCRDFLHQYIADFAGGTIGYGNKKREVPVDFKKMRLLVQRGDNSSIPAYKEKLFSAKRILNHLESIAGWSKSVITTVKHSRYDNVWLITGPAQWMSHPCLMSLVTLILRFASANGPIKFKDQKSLNAAFAKICKTRTKQDVCYMVDVYPKMETLMRNYTKIFDRGSIKKNYSNTTTNSDHSGGGIYSLCNFKSTDKHANAALKKLAG